MIILRSVFTGVLKHEGGAIPMATEVAECEHLRAWWNQALTHYIQAEINVERIWLVLHLVWWPKSEMKALVQVLQEDSNASSLIHSSSHLQSPTCL